MYVVQFVDFQKKGWEAVLWVKIAVVFNFL